MPEMKKRARSVLDYVARIQIEMSERGRRSEGLGATSSSKASGNSGDVTPRMGQTAGESESGESMRMMDSLTKDVILFQQRYFGSLE